MPHQTLPQYLDEWSSKFPDKVWLRDRQGDQFTTWTWPQARDEIYAMAAWLEQQHDSGTSMAILSRNRAHWFMADLAIIASGNVTIPLFTTLPQSTAQYVLDFSQTRVIFVGEAENWQAVSEVVPDDVTVICLPGATVEREHLQWDELRAQAPAAKPAYQCQATDMVSLVFTSGTTGVPKGVIQTHETMILPVDRFDESFGVRENAKFLSYLPLSHIAERQLVEGYSLLNHAEVTFNESLPTIIRDLQSTRPNFFFGPPRVWEQLQQMVLGHFGSQAALDEALAKDEAGTKTRVDEFLGLGDADYCLTAAAPTPPSLIEWFVRIGVRMFEGFGQTEAMGLSANSATANKVGSIGKPVGGTEFKLSEVDELLVKAPGLTPGYYKMPEKTAELYDAEGWLHTGDKARIDKDGFVFLTGRVKDYFKTIQGKFVAPVPIESTFADNGLSAQLCLLGRGYSKTVMVCVLSEVAKAQDQAQVEQAMLDQARRINETVDKHARIGAVILTTEPWTIENEVLTPTMKIRREQVEGRFGETAERLAREAAESGELLLARV